MRQTKDIRCSFNRCPSLCVLDMLVCFENHGSIRVPHEGSYTSDVGAPCQCIGGKGMPKIIRANPAVYARFEQSRVPSPANASQGATGPGNDMGDAQGFIMLMPFLHDLDKTRADGDVPAVWALGLLSAWHA